MGDCPRVTTLLTVADSQAAPAVLGASRLCWAYCLKARSSPQVIAELDTGAEDAPLTLAELLDGYLT